MTLVTTQVNFVKLNFWIEPFKAIAVHNIFPYNITPPAIWFPKSFTASVLYSFEARNFKNWYFKNTTKLLTWGMILKRCLFSWNSAFRAKNPTFCAGKADFSAVKVSLLYIFSISIRPLKSLLTWWTHPRYFHLFRQHPSLPRSARR
jgi:hypothetical protein